MNWLHILRRPAVAALLVALTWLTAAPPAAYAAASAAPPDSYKELRWEEMIPADWSAQKIFKSVDANRMQDGSAEGDQIWQQVRKAWDEAPTKPALNGAAVRLPGYLVPLEEQKGKLLEFLLVPYFGACIHSPPPPANQIVHVVMDKPVGGFKSMDAVWVSGTLGSSRRDNAEMGVSGYRMQGALVRKYVNPLR